jgi:phospholipid/cholesterol/gamma-HCH transport system substrate-binding protein/paraquat-inducible protein B
MFVVIAVLFLLGGRKLFQPTFTFETYFEESVAGLEIGAPVRFRGVPLGQVSEILTSSAAYEGQVSLEKRKQYIVVRAKVSLSGREAEQMQHDAPRLVKSGLRAQTQLAGVTGQQYLALDFFDPGKYPELDFQWTPKYTYVPSAPSLATEIVANAQTFLARLNEIDITKLAENLNALIIDIDKKVGDASLAELSTKAADLLGNANAVFARVDRILATAPVERTLRKLDSVSNRLDSLLADPAVKQALDNAAVISERVRKLAEHIDLDGTVRRIDQTAERLDALIGDNQYDVRSIVQDLRVTADNLRVVSEGVKRYPAGALVGGPPEKVRLPQVDR